MASRAGTVESVWRFPLKSAQGETLDEAEVDERGVLGDRAYALVDSATGKVVSAKNPRLWKRLLLCRARFADEPTAQGAPPPVRVDLPDGRCVTSDAAGAGAEMSAFLGREVAFVTRAEPGSVFEEFWPDFKGPKPYGTLVEGAEELLTDVIVSGGAPPGTLFDLSALHVISTGTLEALQEKTPGSRMDVRRFRPNILVRTDEAGFVENDWTRRVVVAGGVRMRVMIPTPRCVMTALPQDDLDDDLDVLRATARHNRIDIGGLGALPCAGVNASVVAGGRIRVGDVVDVEEAGVRQ